MDKITYKGKVYDVSDFIHKHPGGKKPLINCLNTDCTDQIEAMHPPGVVDKIIGKYYLHDDLEDTTSGIEIEFRKLRKRMIDEGLFEVNPHWYYPQVSFLVLLFITSTFYQSALLMALFWQQLAFVGHDLGHSSVLEKRSSNYLLGTLVGNLLGGISNGWWRFSHQIHHVECNSIENDADIQHLPFMAIDREIIRKPFKSTYHNKVFSAEGNGLIKYQAYTFYPLMMLARFNLYAQSWIYLLTSRERVPYRLLEMLTLAGFLYWYTYYIMSIDNGILFLFLSHAFAGILHVQITLSHFISSVHHGKFDGSWVEHTLKTTTDITCPWYIDWFHGGLQFQIEHHLFPRLPRCNLRVARQYVMEFALDNNLEYNEMGFGEANLILMYRLSNII